MLTLIAWESWQSTWPPPSQTVIAVSSATQFDPAPRSADAMTVTTSHSEKSEIVDYAVAMDIILGRPLFQPNRKPSAVEPKALPRLSGIIFDPTGARAIFYLDGDKPVIVHEGSSVGILAVRRIEMSRVILSGREGLITLQPTFANRMIATNPQADKILQAGNLVAGASRPRLAPGFYERGLAISH